MVMWSVIEAENTRNISVKETMRSLLYGSEIRIFNPTSTTTRHYEWSKPPRFLTAYTPKNILDASCISSVFQMGDIEQIPHKIL
jgi:hypothetical protein